MKNRFRFSSILGGLLSLCVFIGCQNNSSSTLSFSSSSEAPKEKYIQAQRFYDYNYDVDGYTKDVFKLEEFPDLTITVLSSAKDEILFEGRDLLANSEGTNNWAFGVYLADVNYDGYTDIAFYSLKNRSSSNVDYVVKVYDYHNDKFLFNNDNNKSSILDLDDNGFLVIEEINGNGFLRRLERAGRFLNGSEISFEWYNFDFKLKGMFLQWYDYVDVQPVAYISKEISTELVLLGIGDESMQDLVSLESIKIKTSDEGFTFKITKNSLKSSLFNLSLIFTKEGPIDIEVSIGEVVRKERIAVLS